MTDTCRDWPRSVAQPSYKGVEFEVDADTRAVGRRAIVHEYPNRESWDIEDLGRRASSIQVAGYVHGDDADAQANRLLTVCSTAGPGLLVLPLQNPVQAHCVQCFRTFEKDTLGRLNFEMEFAVESAGIGGIVSTILLSGLVGAAVVEGISAITSLFESQFNSVLRRFSPAQPVPSVARDASARVIVKAADAVQAARRAIVTTDPAVATRVETTVRRIRNNATELAYQGQTPNRGDQSAYVLTQSTAVSGFARDITDAVGRLADNAAEPLTASRALADLAAFTAPGVWSNINTLSVRAEKGLTAEVAGLVRRTALLYRAKTLTASRYNSRVRAVNARADIATAFEAEMESVKDPKTELAMMKARNAAMSYLTRGVIDHPRTVKVDTILPTPAIAIATTLYNDASRDSDLVSRNLVRHPMFMPLEIDALAR